MNSLKNIHFLTQPTGRNTAAMQHSFRWTKLNVVRFEKCMGFVFSDKKSPIANLFPS
jgi:hypothetical protein